MRRTADVAILLVDHYGGEDNLLGEGRTKCGISYFDEIPTGRTIGSVAKACALGYYGFGHEIGHIFGLNPDSRVATEGADSLATKLKKWLTSMNLRVATEGDDTLATKLNKLLTSLNLNSITTTTSPISTLSYAHGMVFKVRNLYLYLGASLLCFLIYSIQILTELKTVEQSGVFV